MLKLDRIFKNYQETGAFNEQVNLYGFIDSNVFLTKSGELGVILEVRGVDYECLDAASIDGLTKRLESALKLFDENYRIYQYIFKQNNETIPYKLYGNPVVDTAIKNRIAYLAAKADTLFSLSVYYVIFFEGSRPKRKIGSVLAKFPEQPAQALGDLWAYFSTRKQVVFLDREITKAQATLLQKAESFILQVSDFLTVRLLDKQEAFRILKKTLNFAPNKLEMAKLKYDTFLDYYLCESHLECHRGHLRLDDYYVKVLTLKEPSAQSFLSSSSGCLKLRPTITSSRNGRRKTREKPGGSFRPAPPLPQYEAFIYQPGQPQRRRTRMFFWTIRRSRRSANSARASRRSSSTEIISASFHSPSLSMTSTLPKWTGRAPSSTKSSAFTTRSSTKRNTTC